MSDTFMREEQEDFRKRAMELFNVPLQEGEIPELIFRKAFLKYSNNQVSDQDPNKEG